MSTDVIDESPECLFRIGENSYPTAAGPFLFPWLVPQRRNSAENGDVVVSSSDSFAVRMTASVILCVANASENHHACGDLGPRVSFFRVSLSWLASLLCVRPFSFSVPLSRRHVVHHHQTRV